MKEITTAKGTYLFVEVPNDAKNPIIKNNLLWVESADEWVSKAPIDKVSIAVTIISTTNEITEEQLKSIVEKHPNLYYRDYDVAVDDIYINGWTANWKLVTAKESLQSLIKANGLDETKNYIILKKNL